MAKHKCKTVYVRDSQGDWYKDNKRLHDRPPMNVVMIALSKQLECKIIVKR